MLFEHFPYTNFHDLNLDWLLRMTKELQEAVAALQAAVTALEAAKVPDDGAAGTVLTKSSDADYDMEWAEPTGGSDIPDPTAADELLVATGDTETPYEWKTYAEALTEFVNSLATAAAEAVKYTLPQASSTALGGIKADDKADTDTQAVTIDPETGKLYTAPGASSYELPQAAADTLGGVKAAERSATDTQAVNIDPDTGLLYTAPGGAGVEITATTGTQYTSSITVSPNYTVRTSASTIKPATSGIVVGAVANIAGTYGGTSFSATVPLAGYTDGYYNGLFYIAENYCVLLYYSNNYLYVSNLTNSTGALVITSFQITAYEVNA